MLAKLNARTCEPRRCSELGCLKLRARIEIQADSVAVKLKKSFEAPASDASSSASSSLSVQAYHTTGDPPPSRLVWLVALLAISKASFAAKVLASPPWIRAISSASSASFFKCRLKKNIFFEHLAAT